MEGLVQEVKTGTANTRNGVKTTYKVVVNGSQYGTWDDPGCNAGDTVSFEFTQNGNYLNITKGSLSVVSKGTGAPPPQQSMSQSGLSKSTGGGNSYQARNNDTQDQIMRQSAVKAAIENRSEETDPNTLLGDADIFFKYYKNGITDDNLTDSLAEEDVNF